MSSSTRSLRFLLDENVRVELGRWLRDHHWDAKQAPPSTPDDVLASCSKAEARIVVTNDEDFCSYPHGAVYAVIWLRIPQSESDALLSSFRKLLAEATVFAGRLTLLRVGRWSSVPLGKRVRLRSGIRIIRGVRPLR